MCFKPTFNFAADLLDNYVLCTGYEFSILDDKLLENSVLRRVGLVRNLRVRQRRMRFGPNAQRSPAIDFCP